jgi:benzoyl-CoA reductase/2-hydroxyglutaryl-CoA dehydratase subunit BcrC/BadD/HgdB
VAYASPFVPPEWIAAHGLEPIRIWPSTDTGAARAGVCAYAWGWVQAVVQESGWAGVVSRIPGVSHCAWEGAVIAEQVRETLGIPVLEMEVSPVTDAMNPTLQTRLEALIETVQARRGR